MTTTMGALGIGTMVVQAVGQAANTYQSYQMAKSMLKHQAYMSDAAAQYESWKLAFWSGEEDAGKDILLAKQDSILDNTEAHRDLSIAEARLAEQKKTQKATRIADRKAVESALSKRSSPFLGSPVTT